MFNICWERSKWENENEIERESEIASEKDRFGAFKNKANNCPSVKDMPSIIEYIKWSEHALRIKHKIQHKNKKLDIVDGGSATMAVCKVYLLYIWHERSNQITNGKLDYTIFEAGRAVCCFNPSTVAQKSKYLTTDNNKY